MILIKWLLVILVVGMVLLWIKTSAHQRDQRDAAADRPKPPRRRVARPAPMVSCAHCGLNLPRDEALVAPGQPEDAGPWFCSEAHRKQHVASR